MTNRKLTFVLLLLPILAIVVLFFAFRSYPGIIESKPTLLEFDQAAVTQVKARLLADNDLAQSDTPFIDLGEDSHLFLKAFFPANPVPSLHSGDYKRICEIRLIIDEHNTLVIYVVKVLGGGNVTYEYADDRCYTRRTPSFPENGLLFYPEDIIICKMIAAIAEPNPQELQRLRMRLRGCVEGWDKQPE